MSALPASAPGAGAAPQAPGHVAPGGGRVAAGAPAPSDAPTAPRSGRALVDTFAGVAAAAVGAPRYCVVRLEDGRAVVVTSPALFGVEGTAVLIADDFAGIAAHVLASGEALTVDTALDVAEFGRAVAIRRLLSLPVPGPDGHLGVLCLADKPVPFEPQDVERAQALLPAIATTLEREAALGRLLHERQLGRLLSTVAVAIAARPALEGFVSRALEELAQAMGIAVIGCFLEHMAPVVCPPERAPALEPAMVADEVGAKSTLHLAVSHDGRRVGSLLAVRTRRAPLSAAEQAALERLSVLAGAAWARERRHRDRGELVRAQERRCAASDLRVAAGLLLQAERRLGVAGGVPAGGFVARARRSVVRAECALRAVDDDGAVLAPPELPLRLRAIAATVEDEFELQVRLELCPTAAELSRRSPRGVTAQVLAKVGREALINAAKHGCVRAAVIRLDAPAPDVLRVTIEDDGVGLRHCPQDGTHGLGFLDRLVRTRGGRLFVESAPGAGTRVEALMPVA